MKYQAYPEYKDSGVEWLGDVPKGWKVKRLRFVAKYKNSNVDKKTYENQKQVRLCNYTDVYKNDFITNDMELMIATAKDDQIKKFRLLEGDVIITKDSETADDIASPALVIERLENVVCGYHLAIIRPNENKLLGEFLLQLLHKNIPENWYEVKTLLTELFIIVLSLQYPPSLIPCIPPSIVQFSIKL